MGHGKLKKFAENETFRCLVQPDASLILDKEPGSRELKLREHPIKGNWGRDIFGNSNPVVLELGCGKGDYTIALALRHPEINYIGVDIKGARLWKGAKYATENALPNVAFLRTRIEFIEAFFGPAEVSEIWLTFSDPQLRGSENARLSSPLFLERYRKFLAPGGIIHLKTDSRYLYEYTQAVCKVNNLQVLYCNTDIYGPEGMSPENPSGSSSPRPSHCPSASWPLPFMEPWAATDFQGSEAGTGPQDRRFAPNLRYHTGSRFVSSPNVTPSQTLPSGEGFTLATESSGPLPFMEPWAATDFQGSCLPDLGAVTQVLTFYERMFLEMGLPITYMAFRLEHEGAYEFPGEAFDHEKWLEAEGPRRSFSHQPNKKG